MKSDIDSAGEPSQEILDRVLGDMSLSMISSPSGLKRSFTLKEFVEFSEQQLKIIEQNNIFNSLGQHASFDDLQSSVV